MTRHVFRALAVLLVVAWAGHAFAADTMHIKGLWLTTDYPSVTARAGESTTVKLRVRNEGLAPQRVVLSIAGVPSGWSATLLGDGAPITAAMPSTDSSVPIQLHIQIPAGLPAGTHVMTVQAKGADVRAALPIDVTIGKLLPAKLVLKSKLPSLIGTPKTNFGFQFKVSNQSNRDLLVKLAAHAPQGFESSFTEAYGTQKIASIPIEAGKNKSLQVKVKPPAGIAAGSYPVAVVVSAGGAKADTTMTMQITGEPKLNLTGKDGRISADAVAGEVKPISLVLSNKGSAPATNISLTASPPDNWKVTFQPDKIAELAPGKKLDVQAQLTPSNKAVAGDYMTTFSANGKNGDSSSADFRITVSTSTMWGIVGVIIVAIALLIAVGAVARFGRR